MASVAQDIFRAYVAPVRVFRARVGGEVREDRAVVILMIACILIFIAQWPRLERLAFETEQEFAPLIGATLFGWLFIVPLVAYTIGTLSHLIARIVGGSGSGYTARFALFWALLVASPLWLLWGLVAGFIGPGVQLSLVGAVALAAFLGHWGLNLWVAERA